MSARKSRLSADQRRALGWFTIKMFIVLVRDGFATATPEIERQAVADESREQFSLEAVGEHHRFGTVVPNM
jgi:hypothetical protein